MRVGFKWLGAALLLLAGTATVRAQEDAGGIQRFTQAQEMLQKADEYRDHGRARQALDLYRKVLLEYADLIQKFPQWQPGVTRFRIAYCEDQIRALEERVTTEAAEPGQDVTPGAVPAPPYDAVLQLLTGGKTEDARALLLDAIRAHPDDEDTRLLTALMHCAAGEFENAVFVLEQLKDERSDDARYYVALGGAYAGLRMFDEARDALQQALILDPTRTEIHYNLAQAALQRKPPDLVRARQHYADYLQKGGSADPDLAWLLRR